MNVLGFVPDVDPGTPGALVDVTNIIPTNNGMKGAPTPVAAIGVPALAAACRGAAVATKLDASRRIFAGSSTRMYEYNGATWTDVSRGALYALGADDRWDVTQFGDSSLAATPTAVIQRSPGAGAFADIATAPKAACIETAAGFVVAFNTVDGTYGTSPDRWWCCAYLDETSWTPSVATQATTGRLVSAPGPIVAAKAFGQQCVAYKERSIYVGTYVGSPAVWQFDQVPGDVGCVGIDAITDIGPAHIFIGRGDIFMFDGTRPVSIAEGSVRQWFYNNANPAYLYRAQVVHDKQNNVVWFFYVSNASAGTLDQALVYHLGMKRWGKVTQTIETALNYVSPGYTYDTLPGTFDTLPAVSFDSAYWLSGGRVMSVFDSSHQLGGLTGMASSSSFTTGDFGDDDQVTRLKRVRVGWQASPSTATIAGSIREARGDPLLPGAIGSSLSDGKFDLRQTARWHRVTVSMTGDHAFSSYKPDLGPAGQR